jgi:hypothetical protein
MLAEDLDSSPGAIECAFDHVGNHVAPDSPIVIGGSGWATSIGGAGAVKCKGIFFGFLVGVRLFVSIYSWRFGHLEVVALDHFVPYYINEQQSDIRGIKRGWYTMDERGKLGS